MACNLADFEADPQWPGWPPPDGYVTPMGATLTAGLSNQMVNDYTFPSIYQAQVQYTYFNTNYPPELFSPLVNFDSAIGITPQVNYFDQDNNLPLIRKFHFDAGAFDLGSNQHFYSDTAQFMAELSWPGGGWHHYYFELSDGMDTVETEPDSFYISSQGCAYIPGDVNNDQSTNAMDVVFMVNFLKSISVPQVDCNEGSPAPCNVPNNPGGHFYAAGDANGDCNFNAQDVVYYVLYLKRQRPDIKWCLDCPPASS